MSLSERRREAPEKLRPRNRVADAAGWLAEKETEAAGRVVVDAPGRVEPIGSEAVRGGCGGAASGLAGGPMTPTGSDEVRDGGA